jgi:hypothetical protein
MEGGCNTTKAYWNTTRFLENKQQIAVLQHMNTGLCATVMRCDIIKNKKLGIEYCDKNVNFPEMSLKNIQRSAMVRLWPCKDKFKLAQSWRQRLDCSPSCTVNMEENDVCDPECNTEKCNMDNQMCVSKSPTPPTESPTNSPSINPTNSPTNNPSINPTQNPSSLSPTNNPSYNPTSNPSYNPSNSPSNNPTSNPTNNPTRYPSPPSNNPSYNPSLSPSLSPSVVLPQPFNYLWILLLLVLLYLLCCIPIKYVKQKKEEIKDLEKNEIVEIEIINQHTIKPENMPEYMNTIPPPLPSVPNVPRSRTINKEIDIHNKVWEKKVIGKTVSFTRNKDNYGKADIPAEHLDRVVNELKERSSLKKI